MVVISKIYEKISQDLGGTYHKAERVASGNKDGYSFVVGRSGMYADAMYLKFSVAKDKIRLTDDVINEIRSLSSDIMNINVPNFEATVYIKPKNDLDSQVTSIEDILNKIVEYFKNHNIENVDEITGSAGSTFACNVYGRIQLISENTFNTKKSEATNNTEEKNNFILGIVGAIAGSILGSILIVAIGQLGFVATISGLAMGLATLAGYKKLGGKIDKKGIIISIVIMLIMTYLASRLNCAILIKREVPSTDLWAVFKNMPSLIKYGLVKSDVYYGNMLMTYLFTGIGAFAAVKKFSFDIRSKKEIKKL